MATTERGLGVSNFGPDPQVLTDDPAVVAPKSAALDSAKLTTPTVVTSEAVVERINGVTDSSVTPEQIRAVLAALNHTNAGSPVGVVLQDPASGNIAVRISQDGLEMWRIIALDGGVWNDMEPTLPWKTIAEPLA